jgi:hypothetical protein
VRSSSGHALFFRFGAAPCPDIRLPDLRCKNSSDALLAIDALEARTWGPWLYPYNMRALGGPALIHQG